MIQVKIFESDTSSNLENKINDFAQKNTVRNVQYTPTVTVSDFANTTTYHAMVMYDVQQTGTKPVKVGVTERGDASIDTSWYNKIKNNEVQGAILITKNITDDFIARVYNLYKNNYKIIVHCTCTGWGSTIMERNVPDYESQLVKLKTLIEIGFPMNQCVLRIDPIFPTKNGLAKVQQVLEFAKKLNLIPVIRVRISIFDEYKHVKDRFRQAGFTPMYGDNNIQPPADMLKYAKDELTNLAKKYNIKFETCAELYMHSDAFLQQGCISPYDLQLLQIPIDTNKINPQHRAGCKCLSCKTELLSNKTPCPHGCLYCYWKN